MTGQLPDPERSRAVLVGSDAGLPTPHYLSRPEEVTGELAGELTGTFRHIDVVLGPRPERILDAVRRAAAEATDVLLFYCADYGIPVVDLRVVAQIIDESSAMRPLALLDCGGDHDGFTRGAMMSGSGPSFVFLADPFTETLSRALRVGVRSGPEVLDLVTLKDAIEASFEEIRYFVENEYIGGASSLHLRGGGDVALGVNPARSTGGGLLPNVSAVDEAYADWW